MDSATQVQILNESDCISYCLNILGKGIGSLNLHGTHVTANNSSDNNLVFFFVSDLKIVNYNDNHK